MTTICKYVEGGDLSVCEDEHKQNKFCLQSFTLTKDYNSPIIMTLNQIHARFLKKGREIYQYAPFQIILAKIVKDKQLNSQTTTPETDVIAQVDGDLTKFHPQAHIELPGLTAGEYLIFIQARQYNIHHPMRKLITNIYAADPIEIKRLTTNRVLQSVYYRMDMWVFNKTFNFKGYQPPSWAIPQK